MVREVPGRTEATGAPGVRNLTVRNLTSDNSPGEGGAVLCVADMRGLNASSTIRDIRLEDINLRALVFGFGCNEFVRGVSYSNVQVQTPQQAMPCV